jgi:hypothetical protein
MEVSLLSTGSLLITSSHQVAKSMWTISTVLHGYDLFLHAY